MIVVHLDEVGSTQDEARKRFGGDPVLVTATSQRSGRGRSGAAWSNAPRLIAASVAFTVRAWPDDLRPILTLVAGLAVVDTVDEVSLKWPNDLLIGGAKAGGILTEASGDVAVVGVGINLWWPDPPDGMTAVLDEDPGPAAPRTLSEVWAMRLVAASRSGPSGWDRNRYRTACVTLGADITWSGLPPPGRGRAIDIGSSGTLLVETTQGIVELTSGAVAHVRPG